MKNLMYNIKMDFRINSFRSGLILFFYRILNYIHYKFNNLISRFFLKVLNILWEIFKIVLNINCQISYKACIGSNIKLPHIGQGVIISPKAKIGNNVTIYHQVTIGVNEFLNDDKQKIIIGNNCYLSTGAKVISCVVGENVTIGPNAVVYKNLNSNSKIFSQGIIK